MRGRNLVKLLKALELLAKPAGTTINEMAEQLEVDRRSVYRMINLVEELGFPIYDERPSLEKEKRWKLTESYLKKLPNIAIPDLNLTLQEIISLYLIRGSEGLYKGTEIEQHIKSAFAKLGRFVPEDGFSKLNRIKALFLSTAKFSKDYSGKEEIIDQLLDAMLNKETCHVTYHSFYDDTVKAFKIDPLHFFEHNGGLYLFVNTTTFGEIRTLAVERIKELTKTGSFFEYPKDFDPEKRMEAAFDIVSEEPIEVKIWFSADQARYIRERTWSKTQHIGEQDDSSIMLSMRTSGWYDLKRWVLSYGRDAKVLEPEELREDVLDELKNVNLFLSSHLVC